MTSCCEDVLLLEHHIGVIQQQEEARPGRCTEYLYTKWEKLLCVCRDAEQDVMSVRAQEGKEFHVREGLFPEENDP